MNPPSGFKLRHVLRGHDDIVVWVAWDPEGENIASCSADETIKIWNAQSGSLVNTLHGHTDVVLCIAWSPNGTLLASGSDDRTIRIWDTSTGEPTRVLKGGLGSINDLVWSPDGEVLASGSDDGTVRLWNTQTWEMGKLLTAHAHDVSGLAWSPDGRVLASSSWDKTIKLWDAKSGEQAFSTLRGHAGRVFDIAWTPDGKRLVTGSEDTTVRVWDLQTGRAIAVLEGHTDWVTSVRLAPDGLIIASKAVDDTVRLWRTETGEGLAVLREPSSSYWLTGIAFHPRSPVLTTLGEEDRVIRVWELDYPTLLISGPVSSQYSNAKVVIVGDSGVGKSGLALVLSGQPFQGTESTHGRHIRTLGTVHQKLQPGLQVFREVILWDLAGEPSYRLIQHAHLNEVAVALIVFDAASSTDSFGGVSHWVRALRQGQLQQGDPTQRMKIFLVGARADRGQIPVSVQQRSQGLVQEFGFDGYFETSAKTGQNIAALREAILDAIDWDALPAVISTELFQTIKAFLMAEKAANRLLSTVEHLYRAFLNQHGELPVDEDLFTQFETCVSLVESRGLIQVLSFGQYVLLQPELLDGYASAILAAASEGHDGMGTVHEVDVLLGRFRHPDSKRLDDAEQEKLLLITTIENFLRQEIALRETTAEFNLLVFPSQASREYPYLPEPPGRTVVFSFEGAILNIYSTLAVRLANSGVFKRKEIWKKAISYSARTKGTYGMFVRELGEGLAELLLFFDVEADEEAQSQFQDYVHTHLQRHALPGSVKRKRVFVCTNCGTPLTNLQVERRLERGLDWVSCSVCDSRVSLSDEQAPKGEVSSVVIAIDQEANLQRNQQMAALVLQGKTTTKDYDVFLCHNQEDKPFVRDIARRLKDAGILPWLDEWEVRPGVPWLQALETDLGNINAIAVFVGMSGIGPWQQAELNALVREFIARNRRVIPILLPNSESIDPNQPSFLMNTDWIDFHKRTPDPLRQLVAMVKGGRTLQPKGSAGAYIGDQEKGDFEGSLANFADKEREIQLAINRSDWATARQLLIEAARLLEGTKRHKEGANFALQALEIADDPLKLDGKGLREPLELLADSTRPKRIEKWMAQCKHRTIALSELRLIAASGREFLHTIIRNSTIELWARWFQNATPNLNQINSLPREGRGWPAIRLTRLRLENIKGFHSLKLDFREQYDNRLAPRMCSAIVGDNATGKTTLLQCIALGCLGHSLANQTDVRARTLLRNGAKEGAIELEFELTVDANASSYEAISVGVGLELDELEEDFRALPNNKMTFRKVNCVEHWSALRRQVDFQWGFCCGYGAFRGLRERNDKSSAAMVLKSEIDRVLSLFQPHSTLMDPATLEAILQADVSSFSLEQKTIPLGISDEILKTLQAIIPGMEIEEQDGKRKLIEKYSRVSTLASLSDGPNSMIGLLGHLIRHSLEILGWLRKSETTSGTNGLSSPLKVVGIVLIDEVDLHLHPSWQRLALSQLQDAFPRLQFIVTTHSPLVLGGVPDGRVTVLRRNEEGQVVALEDQPSVKGWRVDQLLTGVHFDVASSYDATTERLITRYARLLNEKGGNDPDVLAAEKEIEEIKLPDHAGATLEIKAWNLLEQITQTQVETMSQTERERMLSIILASKNQT